MRLEYQLTESDFLEYQLYSSSRSKSHNKKRQRNRIILAGLFIVFGVYHTLKDENYIGIIVFGIGALLLFLFYPFYSGWRYKNHFKNHIKETYQNRINIPVQVELNDGFIETKDSSSESKIKGSELKKLVETDKYYFIKLKTDQALIIPKREVENQQEFKTKVQVLGAEYIDELNWKWK